MLTSYYWIEPDLLAGSGMPGLLGDLADDLMWLNNRGVCSIYTLTRTPLDIPPDLLPLFQQMHFPIDDMGVIEPRKMDLLVQHVVDSQSRGGVLLHCRAGKGRTGMALACVLVRQGLDAPSAIAKLRDIFPHYIQTPAQEAMVRHYQEYLQC